MKRMLHHAHSESASAPKPVSKAVKLKRHKPLTKRQVEAREEMMRLAGIGPNEFSDEKLDALKKEIWG